MSMRQLPPPKKKGQVRTQPGVYEEYYCKSCQVPNPRIVKDNVEGTVICQTCGTVLEDRYVDMHSEWRTFSNESNSKDMNRVGTTGNELLTTSALETSFSHKGAATAEGQRLGRIAKRGSSNVTDRRLKQGFEFINRVCERHNLNQVVSDAAKLHFKAAEESQKVRGHEREALAISCVAIALRKMNLDRSLKELCSGTRATKVEVGKAFKAITKALNIGLAPPDPSQLIPRYCSHLGLKGDVGRTAVHVALEAAKTLLHGRNPLSIAASSIYLVVTHLGLPTPIKDISRVCGITESTIRSSYATMEPHLDELLPQKDQVKPEVKTEGV